LVHVLDLLDQSSGNPSMEVRTAMFLQRMLKEYKTVFMNKHTRKLILGMRRR